MLVSEINLIDFRNFQEVHSTFSPGLNYISGLNASGKTNLIEAIYYLSLARSFKKANDRDLIRLGADRAQILLKFTDKGKQTHSLQAEIMPRGKIISLDGEKQASVTKIIGKLLSVVYAPFSVSMFRDEPAERRRFLDASLSLLSPKYLYALTRFKKLLKERNMALAQNYDDDVMEVMTNELVNVSYRLTSDRTGFASDLSERIEPIYSRLFGKSCQASLAYLTDVPKAVGQEAFVKAMKSRFDSLRTEERTRRTTLIGVQKDDLRAELDGKQVYSYASQGQNRLIVLALNLALAEIIREHFGESPVLLLDDVMSDLDMTRKNNLLSYLNNADQVFITSSEEPDSDLKAAVYRISEGKIISRG